MKFRDVVASVVMGGLMCCLAPVVASAQSSSAGLMSASSSGLTASVVGIAYNNGSISAQIIIKNTNSVRVYVQNAIWDSTERAFLGSGESLDAPQNVNGLPSCNDNGYAMCASQSQDVTIDRFSYIDPGDILGVALQYQVTQKPSNPDTITFSLTMLARFAKSDTDNSPDDVGEVREITLAFPYLPFALKQ